MNDGANEGLTPSTALKIILRDEPAAPGDRLELDQMRERVLACPLPDDAEAKDPWGGKALDEMTDEQADEAYSRVCYMITRGLLAIHEGDEGPLTHFDDDNLWAAFRSHYLPWVEANGVTGFQVGYALNLFRTLVGEPAQRNPALIDLG